METRLIEILMIEDDPGDVLLTREALKEAKVGNNISIVRDGEEAIKYLRREAAYQDAPRPDLILLDLNLPKRDGREVLAEIKSDPALRMLPVWSCSPPRPTIGTSCAATSSRPTATSPSRSISTASARSCVRSTNSGWESSSCLAVQTERGDRFATWSYIFCI